MLNLQKHFNEQNLDRARAKNRDIPQAETDQQKAVQQFEKISEHAKVIIRIFPGFI